VKATVCEEIAPLDAMKLQASENTYLRPPLHEEADFYDKFFRMLHKASDGDLTLASFGRYVGRHPDVIRDAIRFSKLPAQIRGYVASRAIPYSNACELARIQEAGVPNRELIEWAKRMVVNPPHVEQFKAQIRRHLDELGGARQFTLGEIFAIEQANVDKRTLRRRHIEAGTVKALYGSLRYFSHTLTLFERGALGYEDSPFSIKGPLKAWRELLALLKGRLLPHFERVLRDYPIRELHLRMRPAREGKKILEQADVLARQLEEIVG
jgi:hypothetical protein